VRSTGGFAPEAIRLANILRDRNATVVIRDYCLSACANYFLVPTGTTYVLKNAIVAWHGGPFACSSDDADRVRQYLAENIERIRMDFRRRYPDMPQSVISVEALCEASGLSKQFFRDRDIDDRHTYGPQTPATKQRVSLAVTAERVGLQVAATPPRAVLAAPESPACTGWSRRFRSPRSRRAPH
jgi:hypothetical protein